MQSRHQPNQMELDPTQYPGAVSHLLNAFAPDHEGSARPSQGIEPEAAAGFSGWRAPACMQTVDGAFAGRAFGAGSAYPKKSVIAQVAQRCKLLVTIERAQNLRAADKNLLGPGTSDPYVRCRVKDKPFPPELAFKTKTIQKNLNPVWHGEDHLLEPVFSGDALEFEVLDQNSVLTDKSLGKAILEYYQFFPNGYNDSLILSDAGKKETGKATLKVSVECDPIVSAGPYDPRCYVKIVRAVYIHAIFRLSRGLRHGDLAVRAHETGAFIPTSRPRSLLHRSARTPNKYPVRGHERAGHATTVQKTHSAY